MNILLNPGSKWGIKIFFLHVLIVLLVYGLDKVLLNFIDGIPSWINALLFIISVPFMLSYAVLCGVWNNGIFGKCTANVILDFVIASGVVLFVYMVIGSLIYLIVRKIKTRKDMLGNNNLTQ